MFQIENEIIKLPLKSKIDWSENLNFERFFVVAVSLITLTG